MLIVILIGISIIMCYEILLSDDEPPPSPSPNLPRVGRSPSSPYLFRGSSSREPARETTPTAGSRRRRRAYHPPTSDLKKVVELIVKTFKNYRQGNSEFAVLFAFPTEDTVEWLQLVRTYCSEPLNRDVNPFYLYRRFIAARPANKKHAEVIILDKLNEWKIYDENILRGSKAIVLYSWIRPCLNCQKVIRRYLSPYSDTKIMVLYTFPKRNNETTIPYIEGVEIHQVNYKHYLPPPVQQ